MKHETKIIIILSIIIFILTGIIIFNNTRAKRRETELIRRAENISGQLNSLVVGAGKTIEELQGKLERESSRLEQERGIEEEEKHLDSRERARINQDRESLGNREISIRDFEKIILRLTETIERNREIDQEIMAGDN